jgi:hypothetical protein
MAKLRTRMSYANVTATLALFLALGGTSYAVLHVRSDDVVDNSLRSRDVRNSTLRSRDLRDRTIRGRDVARDSLGSGAVKESALGTVPRAGDADRVGGVTAQDLRLKCPMGTLGKAGLCIETAAHSPDGFVGAVDQCSRAGRQLIRMPELDLFARSNGPLPQAEWTGSVYRNPDNGPMPVDELEAVVIQSDGGLAYDQVHVPVQHAFRCVALPSN